MATQRRKSSVQKRRSSMKRKYMKSRKVKGGLFGFLGKKAGDGDDAAPAPEKEEGVLGSMKKAFLPVAEEDKKVEGEGQEAGPAPEGEVDGEVVNGEVVEGQVDGGKKKKRKGTKKKKGSKKRKTAKKAKKSKKKKGKK
tara:strand:+ start:318 stop:734 length:417 start_codon:yes stop_codon:yes gene_type:complete